MGWTAQKRCRVTVMTMTLGNCKKNFLKKAALPTETLFIQKRSVTN
jgi:hypothetical protein